MTNYRYLTILMAVVSVVLGDGYYANRRLKSKFRPRPEWFERGMSGSVEELPKTEALVYDEQNDQPETLNFSPYPAFIEGYEFSDPHDSSIEGGKFQRTTNHKEIYENLCPIRVLNQSITNHEKYDKRYEYKPNRYLEIVCLEPYRSNSRFPSSNVNRICEQHDNKCIQLNRTHHFTKRLRVPHGEVNENCWEPTTLTIRSDCQCMWPVVRKGDILKAHLSFDDDE